MIEGLPRPGQEVLQLDESLLGRVHHEVLAAPGGEDRGEHRLHRAEVGATGREGSGVRDQDGLRDEDVLDRAQAVHRQGGTGRDEIDDGLRQAESRRDFDRAGQGNDVHRDAALGEEATGRLRVRCRDPCVGKVGDRRVRRIDRHCCRQAASTVAEEAQDGQLRARLGEEILAGDAEVGDAVTDELDDVAGPDEQDVEGEVLDPDHEASIVLLEHEAGIVEEFQRRFDQAPLVGDREAEAFAHRSAPVG